MRFSAVLAIASALQAVSTPPPDRIPDLRYVLSNNAALGSVEVLYRVEDQVIAVHGDGTVLKQSTRPQLSLLPTCRGTVPTSDVRHLLETILAAHFFDLPRKSYLLLDGDWRTLQMHSISINAAEGRAERDFSAGEYEGKRQEIPESFAQVEKAIIDLDSKAIPAGTRCSVARPLLSEDKSKVAAP
jgi:hypothetical protein